MGNRLSEMAGKLKRRMASEMEGTKKVIRDYTQAAKDLASIPAAVSKDANPVDGWKAVGEKGKANRAAYREARGKKK